MHFNRPATPAAERASIQQDRGIFLCGRLWHCECTRAIEVGQSLLLPEDTMRSELVFGAMTCVSNRFLLTRLASKATRSFHRPNTRIQDTVNGVFERFAHADPFAGVPYSGNLQSFPCAAQGETHAFYEDLAQSVA